MKVWTLFAFSENYIEKVILNDKLKIIDKNTFFNNELKEIVMPSSVKEIKSGAFNCNKLQRVILNEGLEIIGESAFAENELTQVTIPKSVKIIKISAFAYNNITYINFLSDDNKINIAKNAFWYNIYC